MLSGTRLPFPASPLGPRQVSRGPAEVKTFDCMVTAPAANLPAVAAVGTGEPGVAFAGLTEINDVRQGAAFYNRVGAKITIRSVELTGEVFGTLAGLAMMGPVRYLTPLVALLKDLVG